MAGECTVYLPILHCINVGWPGSVHDACVLAHSSLYEKITEKALLPHKPIAVGSVNVPSYLIVDIHFKLRS